MGKAGYDPPHCMAQSGSAPKSPRRVEEVVELHRPVTMSVLGSRVRSRRLKAAAAARRGRRRQGRRGGGSESLAGVAAVRFSPVPGCGPGSPRPARRMSQSRLVASSLLRIQTASPAASQLPCGACGCASSVRIWWRSTAAAPAPTANRAIMRWRLVMIVPTPAAGSRDRPGGMLPGAAALRPCLDYRPGGGSVPDGGGELAGQDKASAPRAGTRAPGLANPDVLADSASRRDGR